MFTFLFLYIYLLRNLALRCHTINVHYLRWPNWYFHINSILIACLKFKIIMLRDLPKVTDCLSCPLPCGWNFKYLSLKLCICFLTQFHLTIPNPPQPPRPSRPYLPALQLMICGLGYWPLSVQSEYFQLFLFCVRQTRMLPRYRFQLCCSSSNGTVLFETPSYLLILTEAKATS